jgi:hypothetical protein
MRDLVVIEDSLIFSMLNDTAFTNTIPCLFGKKDIFLTNATGGCSSCSQKRQERRRAEIARIKACLAGLSTEKRAELKKLFNTQKIRIVYTTAGNQTAQVTF